MISVVIPLYNKKKYILETINSVLIQTFQEFEVIVVNDGSTDKGEVLVREFNNDKVRLYNKENGGVSSARNFGVSVSNYDYIAFLDADDKWEPHFLETVFNLKTKYEKANIFTTNFEIYKAKKIKLATRGISEGYIDNYFKCSMNNYLIHSSSVLIKKSLFLKLGGFKENLTRGEDLDLWSRLAKESRIAYSPKVCTRYIIHSENSSLTFIPFPKNSYAYNLDLRNTNSSSEYKYKRKIVVRKMFSYLLKSGRIDYFIRFVLKFNLALLIRFI